MYINCLLLVRLVTCTYAIPHPHSIFKGMSIVQAKFAPEFVNRIDDVIIFNPLSEKHIEHICSIQLKRMVQLLHDNKDIELCILESVQYQLAMLGFDPSFGARPLKRLLQKEVLDVLALLVLQVPPW